jgi:hypothetical protein
LLLYICFNYSLKSSFFFIYLFLLFLLERKYIFTLNIYCIGKEVLQQNEVHFIQSDGKNYLNRDFNLTIINLWRKHFIFFWVGKYISIRKRLFWLMCHNCVQKWNKCIFALLDCKVSKKRKSCSFQVIILKNLTTHDCCWHLAMSCFDIYSTIHYVPILLVVSSL